MWKPRTTREAVQALDFRCRNLRNTHVVSFTGRFTFFKQCLGPISDDVLELDVACGSIRL
jgi:hypothetical protein